MFKIDVNPMTNLKLVYEERIGDIIFLIGTILAIISTYQAEQSIINKLFGIRFIQGSSEYTIATSSWLFFISSIIFAHISIIRLMELRINTNTPSSTLQANKMLITGNIIKAIGFGLAAIARQLMVNSLSQTTQISQ